MSKWRYACSNSTPSATEHTYMTLLAVTEGHSQCIQSSNSIALWRSYVTHWHNLRIVDFVRSLIFFTEPRRFRSRLCCNLQERKASDLVDTLDTATLSHLEYLCVRHSAMPCLIKNQTMDKVQNKKIMSVSPHISTPTKPYDVSWTVPAFNASKTVPLSCNRVHKACPRNVSTATWIHVILP